MRDIPDGGQRIRESRLFSRNWRRIWRWRGSKRRRRRRGFAPSLLHSGHQSLFRGGFIFPHGIPEQHIQLWATKYVDKDIWALKVVEKRLMREENVILGWELLSEAEFEESAFYREFLSRMDLWHLCTGIVFDGETSKAPLTAISLFNGRKAKPYSESDRDLVRLTVRHLSRALGTMFRLRDAEFRLAANVAAADPTVAGRLVAAWPPVALLLAYELLLQQLARDRGDR